MPKSLKQRYKTARKSLRESDDISEEEKDLIFEFLDANDPERHTVQMPDGNTKAPGTLKLYARKLTKVTEDLDESLTEVTVDEINRLMESYLTGEAERVKDEGLTKGSVRNYQKPLRRFYTYYDDFGVDPEDIFYTDKDPTSVDERDMYTPEEVQAMRDEAKRLGSRDACLVDLLLYTGQRRSAILNLRLKDVDTDDGVFWLNDDAGDLKGASGKRPLLGAQKAVRDWKRQHPTGDPEDYLITHKYRQDHEGMEPGSRVSPSTVYRQLKRIGEAAEIEKPVNAHNFRHYFVTVCKRDYDMDDATIKHLIGHNPDSTVMETTYAHLTDDDYIRDAEEKFGIREPEEDSPLTPPVCDNCSEPLEGDWHSCPYCGMDYSPKAHRTKEQIEESVYAEQRDAEPGSEMSEAVDDLRELLRENPELVEELLD